MKLSRQLAGGAAAALVGLIALPLGTANASAKLPVIETVDAGTLPAETSPYAADTWFVGGGSLGTARPTTQGLVLDGTAGKIQVMRAPHAGEHSLDLLEEYNGRAPELSMISGTATFQVAVMYDHDKDSSTPELFTTLRPLTPNTTSIGSDWTVSRDILNGDSSVQFANNERHTVFDLRSALELKSARVIAFGAYVNPGESAVLRSMGLGNQRAQFFRSLAFTIDDDLAPVSLATFTAKGAEFVMRGLPAGQEVELTVYAPNRPENADSLINEIHSADENGVLRVFFKPPAGATDLVGFWQMGYVIRGIETINGPAGGFIVIENDGAANPPAQEHEDGAQATIAASDSSQKASKASDKVGTLPATGSDSFTSVVIAGALLSIGATLALFARRRASVK